MRRWVCIVSHAQCLLTAFSQRGCVRSSAHQHRGGACQCNESDNSRCTTDALTSQASRSPGGAATLAVFCAHQLAQHVILPSPCCSPVSLQAQQPCNPWSFSSLSSYTALCGLAGLRRLQASLHELLLSLFIVLPSTTC